MTDQFTQLSRHTVIVADTGDIESIKKYQPTDATTNPSLLLSAASDPKYDSLFTQAIDDAIAKDADQLKGTLDRLSVYFGAEITKIVPGVVSTEVDARLSFDTKASIEKARHLIALYKERGIDKSRILIKLASTWEGIKAAEVLEKEGIRVNMTLLFAQAQAISCANVKATLISPFVGRILDWYKVANPKEDYAREASAHDPGVISVTQIYQYYKSIGSKTIVMGASFRSKAEVLALAGCDKLTIAPKLLEELKGSTDAVSLKLNKDEHKVDPSQEKILTEEQFRWELNEDQMATEKLSEGIRNFAKDTVKLETIISERLAAKKAAK